MAGRLALAASASASAGGAGLNSQRPVPVSFDPSSIPPRIAESEQGEIFQSALVLDSDRFRPGLAAPPESVDTRPPVPRGPAKLSLVRPSKPPTLNLDEVKDPDANPGRPPSTAGFLPDSPPALPTTIGGSSAPVYESAGFPLYPVWLPALFKLTKRTVGLNPCPGKNQGAIPTEPRCGNPLGAEGPSFSGLLARPAPRAAYCDFKREAIAPPPVFEPPVVDPRAEPQTGQRAELSARDLALASADQRSLASRLDFATRFWRSAPVFVRGLAISAPLVFTALFFAPKIPMPATRTSTTWTSFTTAARARAAVDLSDDFRHGPDAWVMKEGKGTGWSFDGEGSARPGQLALFRDSMPLSNYRFEFLGQIDTKGLGFVFRAADMNNYQAAKLVVVKAGPVPTLALVRYAVIGGRPGPKTQTPLPLESPRQDTIYKLLIGVEGDSFSVSVNGQLVSAWTDHRLKSGGVGFFADKGEIANLRSIHVIDNQDFLGWLCYQVSWWTADRQKSGVTHE